MSDEFEKRVAITLEDLANLSNVPIESKKRKVGRPPLLNNEFAVLLHEKGLTMKELAKLSKVSFGTIRCWMRGRSKVHPLMINWLENYKAPEVPNAD